MRTHNRLSPEGAWDHEIPGDLEGQTASPADANLAKSTPLLAVGLLFNEKENYQVNGEQIAGTIRTIMLIIGGYVTGTGKLPADLWVQITTVAGGLAVWGWSMWSKKTEVKK